MAERESKVELPKFPLRLMPSVRNDAKKYSALEGVSLNQFINVAVAEKLAVLRQAEWVANRKKPSGKMIQRALSILDQAGGAEVEPGDEIPESYRRAVESKGGRRRA